MTNVSQGFPQLQTPFVDKMGVISQPWYRFLVTLWNRTGQASGTVSVVLDNIGDQQGDLLYRAADEWRALAAGANGRILRTLGIGNNPRWDSISTILDLLSSVQGSILYRAGSGWVALPPGTNKQVLITQGALANPLWANTDGTLFGNQDPNTFFSGPVTNPPTTPTFRAITSTDRPDSVATGLTATGTTQADALALTKDDNYLSTVAVNTGARLRALPVGVEQIVYNDGASNLNVYPAVGSQIDALGTNNPYVLIPGKCQIYRAATTVLVRSTQLG